MKKLIFTLTAVLLTTFSFAENSKARGLLQEALKLYGEHQYVRALDLFQQVQTLEPMNPTAAEYVQSTKQRIMEWELQGKDEGTGKKQESVNWDNLLNQKNPNPEAATNARDIIAARKSLVEKMRNRSTNTDNIVQIQDAKGGLDITLFHDQLFLPALQTLRDEALPILSNVAQMIRTGGDRSITIRSAAHEDSSATYKLYPEFALPAADPTLPQTKGDESAVVVQNLESTRSLILFTYLAQTGMTTPFSARSRGE